MTTSRTYLETPPRDPSRPWAPSPFKRLARTHAYSVAGDAMFTTAMASLVFLNVTNLNQARWQVALALVFTILPFSLAAPFIGPLIDRARGGRKWMIFALSVGRAVVCLLLVWDRSNSFMLYPEFLLALVFSKAYVVARGALVPATVRSDEELVEANAKLAAISGIAAVAGGGPSLLVMWIASKAGSDHGPDLALLLAAIVYVVSAVHAFQLPPIRVAEEPEDEVEKTELHSEGIRHAALAVSISRGLVGFLTFMLALHFKGLEDVDSTASKVGLVGAVVGGQLGFMVGAAIAPRARRLVTEEQMLMVSVAVTGVAGILCAVMSPIAGATLLAFTIGVTSNTAKQSFDAIVQRDAPDANRGRAFAKFETRFQLIWVLGALVPIAITFPPALGFALIGIISLVSVVMYFVSLRRAVAASKRRPSPLAGEPVLVEPKLPSRSFLRGRRQAAADDAGVEDDPTLVMAAGQLPAGSDLVAVGAPAAADPAGGSEPRWGDPAARHHAAPGGAGTWDASADPTVVDRAGLFGEADAPIPAALVDVPDDGLFAVGGTPREAAGAAPGATAIEPPPPPPGPAAPVLYDGAAWLDEDDQGANEWPTHQPHADPELDPTGYKRSPYARTPEGRPQDADPAWRDPGPPSLVDPWPTDAARPVGPRGADASRGPGPASPPAASWPATPPPAPPAAPPAAPEPPAPSAEQLSLMRPDGTYPDPPWRDAPAPEGDPERS